WKEQPLGCSFLYGGPTFQRLVQLNLRAGSTRGDARQGACVTPRDCMWRLSLDRHVIRAILRVPLGFKTALQVEITRKTLSY
ncbi:MAG: hypothetical protein ACPH3E_07125, partial [Paracoccaceae bacterium]